MTENHYIPSWNKHRTVLVAEENPTVREQLCLIFKFEGFQTYPVSTVSHLGLLLENDGADVLITNCHLDSTDMLDELPLLKRRYRGLMALVTMEEPSVEKTVRALHAGAESAFSQPINSEAILRVVRDGLRKQVHVARSPGKAEVQLRGFNQLTPRETEVAELIIGGHTNKEAAEVLKISPRTVEVHRARVLTKVGARNTADLIRIALTL